MEVALGGSNVNSATLSSFSITPPLYYTPREANISKELTEVNATNSGHVNNRKSWLGGPNLPEHIALVTRPGMLV